MRLLGFLPRKKRNHVEALGIGQFCKLSFRASSGCWLRIVGQELEVRRPVERLLPSFRVKG